MTTGSQKHHIASDLSKLLADTYLLYVKTQNFHWNVTGKLFPMLHEFFDKQYKNLAEAIDIIAEQIRGVDAFAPGTLAKFKQLSDVQEDEKIPAASEMLEILYRHHTDIIKYLPRMIKNAQDEGDEGTADVYIERMRDHQKTAWMLKSSFRE